MSVSVFVHAQDISDRYIRFSHCARHILLSLLAVRSGSCAYDLRIGRKSEYACASLMCQESACVSIVSSLYIYIYGGTDAFSEPPIRLQVAQPAELGYKCSELSSKEKESPEISSQSG